MNMLPKFKWRSPFVWTTEESTPKSPEQTKEDQVLNLLEQADAARSWTPDWQDLEKRTHHPVFVYCSLDKGGKEHPIIEGEYREFDGDGRSLNPIAFSQEKFEFWQSNRPDGWSFPIPLRSEAPCANYGSRKGRARIKGKLYFLETPVLFVLDRIRCNGVLFHREKVRVDQPYRLKDGSQVTTDEYIQGIQAWMYVGDNGYWEPVVDNYSTWSNHIKSVPLTEPVYKRTGLRREKSWLKEPFYFFNNWEASHY